MSGGYASRLSKYDNKGICGLPENFDTKRTLNLKLPKLVELIEKYTPNVIVLTGAGISTSAGIPDFRGPNGIWTKEQEQEENGGDGGSKKTTKKRKRQQKQQRQQEGQEERPQLELKDFMEAKPTFCHYAITELINKGIVSYCITQNVDGLHKASGISRNNYSAMHGCIRTEKCSNTSCQTEYYRDYDIGGMSFQPTGRYCIVCKKKSTKDNNEEEEEKAPGGDGSNGNSQGSDDKKEGDLKKPNENGIMGGEDANGQKVAASSSIDKSNSEEEGMNNTPDGIAQDDDQGNDDGDRSVGSVDGDGHPLHDTLLDWNDPLPEDDFEYIQQLIEKPNTLVLCLGTSLRIEPIGLLPLQATEFVIVNLQKTPRDDEASLIIRCNVDTVMEYVMKHININNKEMEMTAVSSTTTSSTTTTGTSASSDTATGTAATTNIERVWTPPPTRLNLSS